MCIQKIAIAALAMRQVSFNSGFFLKKKIYIDRHICIYLYMYDFDIRVVSFVFSSVCFVFFFFF